MSLTVKAKDYLEGEMRKIVQSKIDYLKGKLKEQFPAWRAQAKEELIDPAVLVGLAEVDKLHERKATLEKKIAFQEKKLKELFEEAHPDVSEFNYYRYNYSTTPDKIATAISRIIETRVDELSAQTPEGREIQTLKKVMSEFGTVLMLSQTNRRLVDAVVNLRNKYGTEELPEDLVTFLDNVFPKE